MVVASDLAGGRRTRDLNAFWGHTDRNYVDQGPRTVNAAAPLGLDAVMKRWDGDDRLERIGCGPDGL